MQDSGTAKGTARLVDMQRSRVYSRLVTKDTRMEHHDTAGLSTAVGGTAPTSETPTPRVENYYDQRRARFIAAVTGQLPISEYVQDVTEEVDRFFPPLPQTSRSGHQISS